MKLRRVKRPELKLAIQRMIDGGKRKYGKEYFRLTLKTMVRLLAERQRIDTCVRSVSRAIRELVDEKVVHRINRCTRGNGIKMICRATAYYLLDKATRIFRKIFKEAKAFLMPSGRTRLSYDYLIKQEKNYKNVATNVEILWKSPYEGRASPI